MLFLMTLCIGPKGPVLQGAVGPKRAMTGVSTAAARCIGPVSVVMTVFAMRCRAAEALKSCFAGKVDGVFLHVCAYVFKEK